MMYVNVCAELGTYQATEAKAERKTNSGIFNLGTRGSE
jgi:hypothetical protein